MSVERKYAVIGLGLFGQTLARALGEGGVEIIGIDINPRLVQEVADEVTHAVTLDATDERALKSQGVDQVDVAIVAIGENFEANILCTLILKQTFRIPTVITRAMTLAQFRILALMEVQVLQPERDAARRLSARLLRPNLIDNIELSDGYHFVQMQAPRSFYDRPLKEVGVRQNYGCNIVSIKRTEEGVERMIGVPHPDDLIREGDLLYMIGTDENLRRMTEDLV